ncbi:MAG: hypothetical protein CSA81_06255 [Acidobacteria bacterium]|nr:MAG: hypothetical protein CSA81_06255 [Acidobacteriota bacterium]
MKDILNSRMKSAYAIFTAKNTFHREPDTATVMGREDKQDRNGNAFPDFPKSAGASTSRQFSVLSFSYQTGLGDTALVYLESGYCPQRVTRYNSSKMVSLQVLLFELFTAVNLV